MIPRLLKDVDEATLQSLIHDTVPEGKTIEYKARMSGKLESDTGRLLGHIASLANTAGGDFIIGVEADSGMPTRLQGIDIDDLDKEMLRIKDMALNGIEPRLPSLDIHPVKVSQGRYVLIIRVEQSWIAPHRVKANSKLYGRTSSGRYELDVDELRRAFTMSEGIENRIREFRADRISMIQGERSPVPFSSRSLIVLHVVPRTSFSTRFAIDIATLQETGNHVAPLGQSGYDFRVNLDGFLTFRRYQPKSGVASYTQIFRTGAMESANRLSELNGRAYVASIAYERELIRALQSYLQVAEIVGLKPPYYAFLSLLGVRGATMEVHRQPRFAYEEEAFQHAVNEDALILPEVVIDDPTIDVATVLKPVFDMVWNAFGFSRSFNYDEQGKWSAHR